MASFPGETGLAGCPLNSLLHLFLNCTFFCDRPAGWQQEGHPATKTLLQFVFIQHGSKQKWAGTARSTLWATTSALRETERWGTRPNCRTEFPSL